MSDPTPVSQTQKQKKPGGKKSEGKVVQPLKFLNAKPFVWTNDLGWQGGQEREQNPFYIMYAYVMVLGDYDQRGDAWKSILGHYYEMAQKTQFYRSNSYFHHFWLNQIVEWQGLALYSFMHAKTMSESEGSTYSHPYGQRIEAADAKRITAADRAASAVEKEWLDRFP